MKVRTRYAPSPTGYAHLGFVARVLLNYVVAKKNGGQFIWRNEDTDQKRFVPGSLEYNMKWMREYGFDWDEGPDKGGPFAPYNQTERSELYKIAYESLIEKGYAYKCFCSAERLQELREFQTANKLKPGYDGRCRNLSKEEVEAKIQAGESFTVRVKMPRDGRKIEYTDIITKTHTIWNSNDVDDYIIVKSNGIPTYHLAAMYDDLAMEISHIFRGNEWIATTPVHLYILEGLGATQENMPKIGHFTVILDPNNPGKKFSKRNPAFRANGLLIGGYLQEAVLNYLMLLGWAPKDNRELFTLEEYIEAFDMDGLQKSNPTWDQKKMDWFNGQYSRKLTVDEYLNRFYEWIDKYLTTATQEEIESTFANEIFDSNIDKNERIQSLIEFAKSLRSRDQEKLKSQLALVQERAVNFWEALKQIEFFYNAPANINFDIKQLKNLQGQIPEIQSAIKELIVSFPEDSLEWTHEQWEMGMRSIGDRFEKKHGDIFMLLRVFLVGSPFSPPLFEAMQILGKDEVAKRLG